jgi:hypothetical protein
MSVWALVEHSMHPGICGWESNRAAVCHDVLYLLFAACTEAENLITCKWDRVDALRANAKTVTIVTKALVAGVHVNPAQVITMSQDIDPSNNFDTSTANVKVREADMAEQHVISFVDACLVCSVCGLDNACTEVPRTCSVIPMPHEPCCLFLVLHALLTYVVV